MIDIGCAACGIRFSIPNAVDERRREDHKTFYCPNGHSNYYPQASKKERRIKELESQVARLESFQQRLSKEVNEVWASREELIGAIRECPVPSCPWRSRKRIPRDATGMGRGIERVHTDLLTHLVHDHGGTPAVALLEATSS